MKKWLQNNFLPMWARQTLLQDHRLLQQENRRLQEKVNEMEAYIAGLHVGLRAVKRVADAKRGGQV